MDACPQRHVATDREGFVAASPSTVAAVSSVLRHANSAAPVLAVGARGSGRTAILRLLHARRRAPRAAFVTMHARVAVAPNPSVAAALAEPGGMVVLRELQALSRAEQRTLAAVLDDPEHAARVCATTTSAASLVPELDARVRIAEVPLASLLDRVEDIVPLALDAMTRCIGGATPSLTPAAKRFLECSVWPGNVTELRGVARRATALSRGDTIERRHLEAARGAPSEVCGQGLKSAVRAFRRRYVAQVLAESRGDYPRAARVLGVHPKYLYKLIRELPSPDR